MEKVYAKIIFFIFLSPLFIQVQVPDGFVDERCPGEWEQLIFPNPTIDVLAFEFDEMYGQADFQLFDLQSSLVLKLAWEGEGFAFYQISIS